MPLPAGQTPAKYHYAVRPTDQITVKIDDDFGGHQGISDAYFIDVWPAQLLAQASTADQIFATKVGSGASLIGRTLRLHTTFIRNPGTGASTHAVDHWTGGPQPLDVAQDGSFPSGQNGADSYREVLFVDVTKGEN